MKGTRSKSLNLEIEQKKLPNLNQQREKFCFFFKEYLVSINLWDYNKGPGIRVIRVPGEEEKRPGLKKYFRK